MEPQAQTSSAGNLDPQAVALAKAIRQTESGGNFSAKGKSGEYGGYQFTEPTWNTQAKKYGINAPLKKATKEQQNEVAYKQIKEWKDKGFNPGQIASMWNAGEGEPDAYKGKFKDGRPSTGTNKYKAKYDVPAYAKSVATAYQTLKEGGEVGADPNNPSSTANPNNQPEKGKSVLGFAGNVLKSGFNIGKGLFEAVSHPIETTKNLGKIAIGAGEKLIPGEQGHEKYAEAVGDMYKQRYGGLQNIKDTLYEDPAGALLDASAVLSGGGALAGKVGRISEASKAASLAKGAGLAEGSLEAQMIAEGAKGTSALSKAGNAASKVGQAIDPLRLAGKAVGKVVSPITTRLGALPEKFLATELQLNPSDVRRIAMPNVAGETPYAWLKKNNIFGSREEVIEQLGKVSRESKKLVDDSLRSIEKAYTNEQIPRAKQVLEYINSEFTGSIGNEQVLSRTQELLNKANTGQLTLTDVNAVKRLIDDTLNIYKRSGAVGETKAAQGLANVRNEIKTFIEDEAFRNGVKNIKELNKKTQVAEDIRRSALKKELGQQGNRIVSLTDMITLSGFSAASGLDGGLTAYAVKRMLESATVKTFIARRIAKWTSKSLDEAEQAVKAGTPTPELKRILDEAYQFAKQNPAVIAEVGELGQ